MKGYIFLRSWNIQRNEVAIYTHFTAESPNRKLEHVNLSNLPLLAETIYAGTKIYDNGSTTIYLRR